MSKKAIHNLSEYKRICKFIVVGCINTLITYLVYVVCRWIDLSPVFSNTLGYVIGVANSYIWNKKWVFRSASPKIVRQMGLFLLAFLLAFSVQLAVFKALLNYTHLNEYFVQLVSMVIYTGLNYSINRGITFRK